MTNYTESESAAINAAWSEIRELCSRTNWMDSGEWREAEKLERKQFYGTGQPGINARALCCEAWAEGLDNPDKPAREMYWIRAGYRNALFLGVRHAIERRGDDYNGALVEHCRELCESAITANDANTRRIVQESV
jgi:hypothetical protein